MHDAVNNAGSNIRKPTADFTSADFQQLMSANLESAFALSQVPRPRIWAPTGNIWHNRLSTSQLCS